MLWYGRGLFSTIAILTLFVCGVPVRGYFARPKAYIVMLGETAKENRQLSVSALEGEFLEIKCGSFRDINLFAVSPAMYHLCEHEMHSYNIGTCTDKSSAIRKQMKRTDAEYSWYPGIHYIIAAPVDQSINSMSYYCLNYNLKFMVTVSSGPSVGFQNMRASSTEEPLRPVDLALVPASVSYRASTVYSREATSFIEPSPHSSVDPQTMAVPSVTEDARFHDIRPLPRTSMGVSPWSPLNAEEHYERRSDYSGFDPFVPYLTHRVFCFRFGQVYAIDLNQPVSKENKPSWELVGNLETKSPAIKSLGNCGLQSCIVEMKFLLAGILFALLIGGYADSVGYESEQSGYEQAPESNSGPMSSNGGDQQAYNSDGNQEPTDETGSEGDGQTDSKDNNTNEGDNTGVDDNSVGDDGNKSGSNSYPSGYENKAENPPNPPMSATGGEQLQYQQEAMKFRFTR